MPKVELSFDCHIDSVNIEKAMVKLPLDGGDYIMCEVDISDLSSYQLVQLMKNNNLYIPTERIAEIITKMNPISLQIMNIEFGEVCENAKN